MSGVCRRLIANMQVKACPNPKCKIDVLPTSAHTCPKCGTKLIPIERRLTKHG